MLTKKQLSIFGTFIGNIFKEYSYKEIKKLSNEKSNNAFQLAIKEFKKENLIKEKKVGTSRLYTLNIENEFVYHYLSIVSQSKLPKQAYEEVKLLKRDIVCHHINYDKKLTIKENCITLCNQCHAKTNFNRTQWTIFFQSLLTEKYGYKYTIEQKVILEYV